MTQLAPSVHTAPTNPWQKRNTKRTLQVVLASILPAVFASIVGALFALDPTITVLLVFLPVQVVTAAVVGRMGSGKRGQADALLVVFTLIFSSIVAVLLISVVWSVVQAGFQTLSWTFLSQNNIYISPTTSLDYGGVGHSILGTLLIVGLTTIVTVPLGIAIAVYLVETNGKARGTVRTLIQAMSGLPSVVAGLFVYSSLIVTGVTQYAGWAGSLALLPLMLPTVTRMAEESLRLVPVDLRNGALALGAPRYAAFFQVVLPAAKTGLVTAILLGVARIIGETAPLLLTTFAANSTNLNVFSGSISSLPTYLYQFISNGFDTSTQRAWGAALVILILVGILFTAARILGRSARTTSNKKRK